MRSRTRRRSTSSFVSPGPRPPMPPARRESETVGALGQARQPVLELGELHLELAVPGARVLGEDVEDQLGAVDHAQVEPLARLRAWVGVRF